MQHKTILSDCTIAWRSRNTEAEGIPILLIHGAGGAKEIWLPLRRLLAQALPDRPIVILDLPGHGESTLEGRDRIEDYARDVRDFTEAQNWPQVDLVGHSMGGAAAQVLATEESSVVRRLVLIGTGPTLKVHPLLFELLPDRAPEAFELIRQFGFGPDASPRIIDAALQQLLNGDPHVALNDFRACDTWDAGERLAKITAPTLVVAGEYDNLAPVILNQKLSDDIPDAGFVVLSKTGHMIPLEQDRELCNLLVEHLGD